MSHLKRIAGEKQESQVSYFLHRYFGNNDNYRILNDLHIEVNGVKSQIDHLVIYKAGFIVVESKSIKGEVRVNSLGEWERSYKGEWFGIPSPVKQAAMQIDNLKALLRKNSSQLLGKLLGLQKGFGGRQYKIVVAISSSARLDRDNMPADISKHIVKTEFLVDKIRELTEAADNGLKSFVRNEARFTDDEMDRIYAFLKGYEQSGDESFHQEVVRVSCRNCGETEALSAQYGRYGYYAKCAKCSANTALRYACPVCGSDSTRTRKSGSNMHLDCRSCNKSTPLSVKWSGADSS